MVIFYSYVSLPEGISWYINSTVTPKQIINPRFCTNCYLECSSFKPRSHHSFYIDASMIPIKDQIYGMIQWISVSDYNIWFYVLIKYHTSKTLREIEAHHHRPSNTTCPHLLKHWLRCFLSPRPLARGGTWGGSRARCSVLISWMSPVGVRDIWSIENDRIKYNNTRPVKKT